MTTTASSSCSTSKETLATPRSNLGCSTLTDRRRARADYECRWWREAQDNAGIDAQGVPHAAVPSGPSSYGMKMLKLGFSMLAVATFNEGSHLGCSIGALRRLMDESKK
ncbi:hypothetical protein GUJ93_ZPchr0006g41714 [Zizania palustris]|uniref:Uncharacterized protein n=1 Tax=Zizania palustris TaxID=103762 RepID=A0A8J5W3F4_ZIZPA|nr:hypothetical protein GUJ93_ZPchr0006g41714 [Zizania palustris]